MSRGVQQKRSSLRQLAVWLSLGMHGVLLGWCGARYLEHVVNSVAFCAHLPARQPTIFIRNTHSNIAAGTQHGGWHQNNYRAKLPQASGAAQIVEKVDKYEGSLEMDQPVKMRSLLILMMGMVLLPVMIVTFFQETVLLNHFLHRFPVWVHPVVYAVLSSIFLAIHRSQIFGESAEVCVVVLCKVCRRFGLAAWRVEMLGKLAKPFARAIQGTLFFLTANLFLEVIPEDFNVPVPKFLRFLDLDGDGVIVADEIEHKFFFVSERILGAYLAFLVGKYLIDAKTPPKSEMPPYHSDIGPIHKHLSELKHVNVLRKSKAKNINQFVSTLLYDKIMTVGIWVVVVWIWQNLCGIEWKTLVAVGGVGGLAFGLAAKNITENVICGALIFLNRKLVEGEEICTQDGSQGVVLKVGLTSTVVTRLDGEHLILPNSKLVADSIVNVDRRTSWLIEKSFPLVLSSFTDLSAVVEAMNNKLRTDFDDILLKDGATSVTEKPLCYFDGYGHQGAQMKVRAYVDGRLSRHEFYHKQSEVLLALSSVALEFDGAGIGLEAHMVAGTAQGEQGDHMPGEEEK